MSSPVAVLLINTGSPEAPTAPALKTYLAEFLGDPRVVEAPRWKWMPVLHGIILRTRPPKSAKRYEIVWTPEGSPLVVNCRNVAGRLNERFSALGVRVYWAMCYGHPNVDETLRQMLADGVKKILVFPMFAQYSSHTSASCFDLVFRTCLRLRDVPQLRLIHDYHDNPLYIDAIREHVLRYWEKNGSAPAQGGRLLFSFHGIPQASIDKGDEYKKQCERTAELAAAALGLQADQWALSFQSRFGPDPWIEPYTSDKVVELAQAGVRRIDVVCPGFAADCLETLEEINDELRHTYLNALPEADRSPEAFHYIPALNDSDEAVTCYEELVRKELGGWL